MNETESLALVKAAIEELNDDLGYPALENVTAETELFGGAAGIDSLSLVRIIAEVERAATDSQRRPVVLADERAMSRRNSPYRTAGTLAALLRERLAE
jgi:acyl carrier protein